MLFLIKKRNDFVRDYFRPKLILNYVLILKVRCRSVNIESLYNLHSENQKLVLKVDK